MGKEKSYRFGIRDPQGTEAEYFATVSLNGKTMATTGTYERWFEQDGKRYHHILDPRTGYPAESDLISVSVISENGLLADCLSTTLFLEGKQAALSKMQEEEYQLVIVDKEGTVFYSPSLEQSLEPNPGKRISIYLLSKRCRVVAQNGEGKQMKKNIAGKISLMGLLFALAMAFSYLESMIVIPGLLPGIRLGLSNLVTMYCLFFLGKTYGYTMAVMKSVFVSLTRGMVAGALSLCGGLFSVSAILLVDYLSRHTLHYMTLSVIGAVFHNIGQMILARYLTNVFLYYYIPVLLIAACWQ